MSYTVLYREFRPKKFSEIVGQDNIVTILKNQIKKDKISHAYLFSGIRGTGKTSTAKVFAKSICCLDGKDGEACGVCASCRDIQEGSASDIIEIDAASNRGINEIRELKENVGYMPSFGRYRVYIIDEVHMLTPEAFNALLKTLEEPPEHIVFIFATTESNRILPTILSRCQRFDFVRIDRDTVVRHLEGILEKKGIGYEEGALELIAVNTEGALRDALSLLDKAISVSNEDTVTVEGVNEILGLIGDRDIQRLASAVLNKDVNRAVTVLNEFLKKGREASSVISELIEYYSNKIIAANVSEPEKLINKSSEYIDSLVAEHISKEDSRRISDMIYSLSKLKNDMRFFSDPHFVLSARIISLCLEDDSGKETVSENVPKQIKKTDSRQIELLNDRINALTREVERLKELSGEVEKLKKGRRPEITNLKMKVPERKADRADKSPVLPSSGVVYRNRSEIKEIEDNFSLIITYIKNRGGGLIGEIASRFQPVSLRDNVLVIYPADSLDMMDLFLGNNGEEIFTEAVRARLKKNVDVEFLKAKTVIRDRKGTSPLKSEEKKDEKISGEREPKTADGFTDEDLKSLEASLPGEETAAGEAEAPADFDDEIKKIFLVEK